MEEYWRCLDWRADYLHRPDEYPGDGGCNSAAQLQGRYAREYPAAQEQKEVTICGRPRRDFRIWKLHPLWRALVRGIE